MVWQKNVFGRWQDVDRFFDYAKDFIHKSLHEINGQSILNLEPRKTQRHSFSREEVDSLHNRVEIMKERSFVACNWN